MVLAMFEMSTLSLYYIVFGCTVTILIAIGVLGDIIRISGILKDYVSVEMLDIEPEKKSGGNSKL
jgi:hypothetical protein